MDEEYKRIKDVYGESNLHRYIQYVRAGIPEVFWRTSSQLHPTSIRTLTKYDFIALGSDNHSVVNAMISEYIKYSIAKERSAIYRDVLEFMSDITDKYGSYNFSGIQSYESRDIIAVTNITVGDVFDKFSERFAIAISSLMNRGKQRKIILGLEHVDQNSMKEAYGQVGMMIVKGKYVHIK